MSDGETVEFARGMRVVELGNDVVGEIVCKGKKGEWVIREPDGNVVVCREENLAPWIEGSGHRLA